MNNIFQYSLFFVILIFATCKQGVDLSTLTSTQSFACLLKSNYTFLNVRAWRSYGAVDPNAPTTISNAIKAGFEDIGVYMFPCFNQSKTPQNQVAQMLAPLKNSKFNGVWIDMETNTSPGCGWTKDFDANCQFTAQLVNAVKANGKQVGIYASLHMWTEIMGAANKCPKFTDLPLWYAHYDHIPSFNDWTPFGGWLKPSIKQFAGTTSLCNAGVDLNYKP